MPKIFKLFNNETFSDVPMEKWCWEAYYNDGTILKQFDDTTGFFHQFKEIDQSKLHTFRMVRDDGSLHYDLIFKPTEMKLIHFYINSILENGQIKMKSYCFGYEKNINGTVFKSLATVLPSDYLIISDDRLNLVVDVPKG